MIGTNATTGYRLAALCHIKQSVRDILSTPIGTRVMRRDYGSHVPGLLDQPMTPATLLRVQAAAADAMHRWEPRVQVQRISVDAAPAGSVGADGRLSLRLEVLLLDSGRCETLEGISL